MQKPEHRFQFVNPQDAIEIQLIASWYETEWKIEAEASKQKIRELSSAKKEFQILMYVDGKPVCTGGIYNHVGILDKMPALRIYKHWLALIYTPPEYRGNSYAFDLCRYIQDQAGKSGLKEIFLFTHTAESLYRRLGWTEIDRFSLGERNIVIMKKSLQSA